MKILSSPGLLEVKVSLGDGDLEGELTRQVVEDGDIQREGLAPLHGVRQADVGEKVLRWILWCKTACLSV